MSRRPNPIPKYRHYKPKDLAVVRIDGRDHYLGKHGSPESRERYHRLLASRAGSGKGAEPHSPSTTDPAARRTVDEVILAFWDHAQSHYRRPDGSSSEELGNLKVALRPLRRLYGSSLAKDFGPLALRMVRDEMVRSGLARTSVNDRVNRIRRAFKWAASVEMIPALVVQALATVPGLQRGRTAAREAESVGPVAIETVRATLPFLSRPVAGMVRLQLLTGMRPGEACSMRGVDLTIDQAAGTYRPASHKSAWRGKAREIPLGPRAVELIRSFLKPDPEAFLFDPREAVAEHHAARGSARLSRPTPSELARREPVPGSGHARRYRRASYRNAVIRACDRAFPHPTIRKARGKPLAAEDGAALLEWRKIHRWHPNQLRHTVATDIRARFGLEASQVVLGHSRADVTQVYAERDLARAREVMEEIG